MMIQTSHAQAVALTPLGDVTLEVIGSSHVAITVASAEVPELPKGMTVDGALLFSVRLSSSITRTAPIRITASAGQNGDPETGEWLDSMSFESARGVLQVAIRDDEWLAANRVVAEPVQYDPQGLSQVISEAPGGIVIYASVAWRTASTPVQTDNSTWFAADLLLPG